MKPAALALIAFLSTAALASGNELDPGTAGPAATDVPLPPGVYLVTEVYAGSVVSDSGATTTYSTLTVHAAPGTYARLLDVVGTGAASAFDGLSFNGRARLRDGRAVAGAYYQTFVRTATAFVPVNIVFFQDDSETRALVAPTSAPTIVPASPRITVMPGPTATATRTPSPAIVPAPTMPARAISAGVALASDGPTLSSIEILRGRVARLWPRAFVDGVPVRVTGWRVVGGAPDTLSRTSGSGGEATDAIWSVPTTLPSILRFEVSSDAFGGRTAAATLAVLVRSPALEQ